MEDRPSSEERVRVLLARPRSTRLALAMCATASAVLLLVCADDFIFHRLSRVLGPATIYPWIAGAFLVGALVPWLTLRRRPKPTLARVGPGEIEVGDLAVSAGAVQGFSVARAARGFSIAIETRRGVTMFAVASAEGVAKIARALRVTPGTSADVRFEGPRVFLVAMQVFVSLMLVVAAPGYLLSASTEAFLEASSVKSIFAVLGMVGYQLSPMLVVAQRIWPKKLDREHPGEASSDRDDQADLHLRGTVLSAEELAALMAEAPAPAPLARGPEVTAAWLERLDALPAATSAYRDATSRSQLWTVLADDGADEEVRLAAARILARSHREEPGALVRVVVDVDARARIAEAAFLDAEDAAACIDAQGPLFRAR